MTGGFRAKSGWYFRREQDGSVTIWADDTCGDARDVTFDPNTWASVVASVSAAGETAETYRSAAGLHAGTPLHHTHTSTPLKGH